MTLHLTLTETDRNAVHALRRDPTIRPVERDRVEMVLLADGGWSAPRIAHHLACQPATVRGVLKRFVIGGLPSLRRRPPGPPPDPIRRAQVETALTALLADDRTWTADHLATALGEQHDIVLSTRQTRKYLARVAAWRRTVRSLRHKQNPVAAAHAAQHLGRLQAKPRLGSCGLRISTRAASLPACP